MVLVQLAVVRSVVGVGVAECFDLCALVERLFHAMTL